LVSSISTQVDYIELGKVGRPHGLAGDNHIEIWDHHIPITSITYWYIQHTNQQWQHLPEVTVQHCYDHHYLLINPNHKDRTQAQALTNRMIGVTRNQLPILPKGSYYWHDLIGLAAINTEHVHLGTVKELMNNGAHDLLVVKGQYTYNIPYVDAIIKQVSLPNQQIIVDWPQDAHCHA
jgi:16S rRNA processing protein RimM